MSNDLPDFLNDVIQRYPAVWERYCGLSDAIGSEALDARSQRLVKLGIAIGAGREGAVHAHTRKCGKAGISQDELRHAALLGITTIGWSGAMAALSWIQDEIGKD